MAKLCDSEAEGILDLEFMAKVSTSQLDCGSLGGLCGVCRQFQQSMSHNGPSQ